jgi:uncharacterized protein (TIGR03382 family)
MDGSATYTPAHNFNGTDTFSYFVSDGSLQSVAAATVTITVENTPDDYLLAADAYDIDEDQLLDVGADNGVLANDADPDGLGMSASVVERPTHGELMLSSNGAFMYTPALDYVGTDMFVYSVSSSSSAQQRVTISVNAVNDAPLAVDGSASTDEEIGVVIQLVGSDVDGDMLRYRISGAPPYGDVVINGSSATYTPRTNVHGTDSFTFVASDGWEDSDAASVVVTIAPVNDPPSFVTTIPEGPLELVEGTPFSLSIAAEDVDLDALRYSVQPMPEGSTLSDAGLFAWTPAFADVGVGALTFAVFDGTVSISDDVMVTVRALDNDMDGAPDTLETIYHLDPTNPDTDEDTIKDGDEFGGSAAPLNSDDDGVIDALDTDSDNDGLSDADERGNEALPRDTDGDGQADFRDTNSDDDTVLDALDNCPLVKNENQDDADQNGIGDACDEGGSASTSTGTSTGSSSASTSTGSGTGNSSSGATSSGTGTGSSSGATSTGSGTGSSSGATSSASTATSSASTATASSTGTSTGVSSSSGGTTSSSSSFVSSSLSTSSGAASGGAGMSSSESSADSSGEEDGATPPAVDDRWPFGCSSLAHPGASSDALLLIMTGWLLRRRRTSAQ